MSTLTKDQKVQILLGEGYLKLGKVSEALEAYEVAGVEPPKDKLIAVGCWG